MPLADLTDAVDHNDGRWLTVQRLPSGPGLANPAGWYVVRTCRCHRGERATLPLPDKARAERVRQILLGKIKTPSVPKLTWPAEEVLPPPLAVGQIWRDRHRRDGKDRYVRIESMETSTALVETVDPDNGFAILPRTTKSRIPVSRFRTERLFVYIEESVP
jgi:hypothetical protein